MTRPRQKLNVSYRVLDASGHTLEVVSQEGFNRNNIKWRVERRMKLKYKKQAVTLEQIKVENID